MPWKPGLFTLDLFDVVERGIDMFDCVSPTRMARNGTLFIKIIKILESISLMLLLRKTKIPSTQPALAQHVKITPAPTFTISSMPTNCRPIAWRQSTIYIFSLTHARYPEARYEKIDLLELKKEWR